MIRELVNQALGPDWLVKETLPNGEDGEEVPERFLYTVGLLCDAFLEKSKDGFYASVPETAPDDAIPYLCQDRGIVRGPEEPRESINARLTTAITDHQKKGLAWGLLTQIQGYCAPYAVRVHTVDQRGTWKTLTANGTRSKTVGTPWDWDGATPFADYRGRFWVIVEMTPTGPFNRVTWGSRSWGQGTWGSDAPRGTAASLRSIVSQWKPAGTACHHIILAMDPVSAAFDPTETAPPMPDGTWGKYHKVVGGVAVRARDANGRYLPGT